MSDREKLIEYLDTHCIDGYGELESWQVADFILADRKRIVEPLVKYFKLDADHRGLADGYALRTLKNAGAYNV